VTEPGNPSDDTVIGGDDDERIGRRYGEYRLVRLLGRGGMGAVYEAEHVRLGRRAAVKVIHPELAHDRRVMQRFAAEALTVARLQHPHIVDVIDVAEQPEPHCLMELLRGRSLAEAIARGPLSEPELLSAAAQILEALAFVHARGIVHRDIKPDNIFLVDGGARGELVKLLDFGIAKIRDSLSGQKTTGGALIGTPLYMSPEQIEGAAVDARTDLYAFGMVLYEAATGHPPLSAPSLTSLLSKQLLELPPPPQSLRPELSGQIGAVIMRCIAKSPEDRFADADAVLEALSLARAVPSSSGEAAIALARLAAEQPPTVRVSRRRAMKVGAVAGMAVVAAVLAMLHRAPVARPPASAKSDPSQPASADAPGGNGAQSPSMTPPQSPSVTPAPAIAPRPSSAELAEAALASGDAQAALTLAREAVGAHADRDGWRRLARVACAARSNADYADALAHLTVADALAAKRACRPPKKKLPRSSGTGAPIVE
jgi:serine/threonine protein kinase